MKRKLAMAGAVGLCLAALAGCTVRGGWPRFVRPGEAWGWHQAQPKEPGK